MKDGADTDHCKWLLATVSGEELEQVLVRIIPHPRPVTFTGDMYFATRD
jgi:hypothetical protein